MKKLFLLLCDFRYLHVLYPRSMTRRTGSKLAQVKRRQIIYPGSSLYPELSALPQKSRSY